MKKRIIKKKISKKKPVVKKIGKKIQKPKKKKSPKKSGSSQDTSEFSGSFDLFDFSQIVKKQEEKPKAVQLVGLFNLDITIAFGQLSFILSDAEDWDDVYTKKYVSKVLRDLHFKIAKRVDFNNPSASDLLSLGFIRSGNLFMIPMWLKPCLSHVQKYNEDGSPEDSVKHPESCINGITSLGIKAKD